MKGRKQDHGWVVPTVNASIWRFFVASLIVLLISVGASNFSFSWLTPVEMNAISTPALPEPLQIKDTARDVIIPLAFLVLFAFGIQFLPRNKWTLSLANGALLFVATRYILWRLLTINTAHPISLVLSVSIYAYELLYVLFLYLEFIPSLSYDPDRRSRQADRLARHAPASPASVDIFIATYNESSRQIRRCIYACKLQDYDNKKIYVLDDGNRPEIKRLAEELEVEYITRTSNEHRKAGNLNNALKQTSGDLIAVIDCDFIPFRNLLQRTVGFFASERVAIVQTPQHYFMSDFHARNLGAEGLIPSDVNMFYGYQQVIRDNYNAVICVGTSYVARRKALESIGGYVTTCIIEDYQTSSRLITEGWQVVYLNEILSTGETPGLFRDYLDQRLRWLQGNLQILLPSSRIGVLRSKISPWQKIFYGIHYASNFMPVGRAFFLFIPLLSLFLGNQLIIAPVDAYLLYALPFVLFLHTIPSWSSGHHVHQIWNEVYETITCVPWTVRLFKILRRPFAIYGKTVTPKDAFSGDKRFEFTLGRHLIVYLVLFICFFVVREIAPILNPSFQFYGVQSEGREIMIWWNTYNLIIVVIALLCCIEKPFRRSAERLPVSLVVRIQCESTAMVAWGVTTNLSETGARVKITSRHVKNSHSLAGCNAKVSFIDCGLDLPATVLDFQDMGRENPFLSLQFGELTHRQEATLFAQIYDPNNQFLRARQLSVFAALALLAKSLLFQNSLIRDFD